MGHTEAIDEIRELYVNAYGRKWLPQFDAEFERLVGDAPKAGEKDTRTLKHETAKFEAILARMKDGAKAAQDLIDLAK